MGLSDRCKDRVNKAQRVVIDMVATIAFYFKMVDIYLDNIQLSARDKSLMYNYLIPGHYLKLAAGKERDLDRKANILKKARELLSIIEDHENLGKIICDYEIEKLDKAAKDCAQFFQRSSSCVEGRNAQLALRHQGIHQLSNRHLQALTVIHNYYVKRRDGTTAAGRFFET